MSARGHLRALCRCAAAAALLLAFSHRLGAGPIFSEQTAAEGVEFTHHIDIADHMAMGAGGAWGDYDDDGWLDLYVADRVGPNKLFHNLGLGNGFEELGAQFGLDAAAHDSTGALWGDYDNDGDSDLLVMGRGDQLLFRNDGSDGDGGWIFTDVTQAIGVDCFGRTSAAVYGDYDNDGWLDLYIANHSYPYELPQAGDPDRSDCLFHNVAGAGGQREFVNVTGLLDADIIADTIAHSVGFIDYDNDSDLDMYVANELLEDPTLYGNVMWRNDGPDGNGGWIFTDATAASGTTLLQQPMGLAIGDYNGDGWLDMSMSDTGPNYLYHNNGDGTFTERGADAGIERFYVPGETYKQVGWGLVFIDQNLDGWEDLYVGTGSINQIKSQPNPFFRNNGDPTLNTFTDLTDVCGCNDPDRTRAVIKGDYDNDGDEDVYIVDYGQNAHLYRNDQAGGDFLVVRLIGTVSNRDAIGARVKLSAAGLPDQHRMVQSGSTTGGGNDLRLLFAATGAAVVDRLEIVWPSGLTTVLTDIPVHQQIVVVERPNLMITSGPAAGAGSQLRIFDYLVAEAPAPAEAPVSIAQDAAAD